MINVGDMGDIGGILHSFVFKSVGNKRDKNREGKSVGAGIERGRVLGLGGRKGRRNCWDWRD